MSLQGFINLRSQWSILGEFNNLPQEDLIEWIKSSTRAGVRLLGTCVASVLHTRGNAPTHTNMVAYACTDPEQAAYSTRLKQSFSKSDFVPSFIPPHPPPR